jgi:alkylhydroperoxidase/carboxymuconolactone decarboxylase family protein YurZ
MSDIPLKEFLEQRIDDLQSSVNDKLTALDSAREKAEQQMNKRLEGMNEFRETLSDQAARLMPRTEYDFAHKSLDEKVRALEAALAKSPTKSEIETAQKVLEEKIRNLELAKANQDGRGAMISALTSAAISIIVGVVIFVISRYVIK